MSADNYLYVCKRLEDNKWVVAIRFASWDEYPEEHEAGRPSIAEYDDPQKAVIGAHQLNSEDERYSTEYGVHLSPATREAVYS